MTSEFRLLTRAGAILCASMLCPDMALAQIRTYNVQWSNTTPTIDAVISPGEWAAAGPVQGDWKELRMPETDMDTANNRFQMMWTADGLYILYQVNQTVWPTSPGGNPEVSFGSDNLNLYFDPNTDDEPNFVPNPEGFDLMTDGYQLAFNQNQGTSISTDADRQGVGFFTEAHVDTGFGDAAMWNQGGSALAGAGLQDIVVAQKNDSTGGLAEIFFPWANFNADAPTSPPGDYNRNGTADAADYPLWRETLNQAVATPGEGADGDADGTVDQDDYAFWRSNFGAAGQPGISGLYHPFAPANSDTWFYQMGQITSADPNNFLPVYNWTPSQSFTAHPHAEITFVGRPAAAAGTATVPEPTSVALLTLAAIAIVSRIRRA